MRSVLLLVLTAGSALSLQFFSFTTPRRAPIIIASEDDGSLQLPESTSAANSSQLDTMGPIVITETGEYRTIANWDEMSPEEKELTKRRIAKRNAQRLKKLRGGWSAATIRRRALVVMESEMEYRRRVSGDKTYLRKQAEKTLDDAVNAEAQRWLQLGGRTVTPPEDSASLIERARADASAAGISDDSESMRRSAALLKALISGPSVAKGVPGARVEQEAAAASNRYALPGDFDGTRQSVARAIRADRYRTSLGWGDYTEEGAPSAMPSASRSLEAMGKLDEGVRGLRNKPAAEAAILLGSLIDEAKEAGVRDDTPAMKRASALAAVLASGEEDAGEEEQAAADTSTLDAKLDAVFSEGYVDPDLFESWGSGEVK